MFTCSDERQDEIEGWKSRGERGTEEVKEVPRLQELSGGVGYLWPGKEVSQPLKMGKILFLVGQEEYHKDEGIPS